MARIRTIKPSFFRHEGLQDLEAANPGKHVMLTFAALWGHCDKVGAFEWKPRTLKLDILPFLDFDMADTLALLESGGFIESYTVDGKKYGLIQSFAEHQRIGGKEAQEDATYPPKPSVQPVKHTGSNGEAVGIAGREGKGIGREDKLAALARATPGLHTQTWDRWLEYRTQIRKPLKAASLEEAAKAMAAFGADQAAVVAQSIANSYQGLFPLKGNGPAKPSASVDGEKAWQDAIADRHRTPKLQAVLDAIGGISRIKMRTPFDEPKVRAEFMRAWEAA